MIPIHELLSRIQWDEEFGKGNFTIGYYDRVENKIVKVSLHEVIFEHENHHSFKAMDRDGIVQTIPFHRIKEVYKDNKLIWHRDH